MINDFIPVQRKTCLINLATVYIHIWDRYMHTWWIDNTYTAHYIYNLYIYIYWNTTHAGRLLLGYLLYQTNRGSNDVNRNTGKMVHELVERIELHSGLDPKVFLVKVWEGCSRTTTWGKHFLVNYRLPWGDAIVTKFLITRDRLTSSSS